MSITKKSLARDISEPRTPKYRSGPVGWATLDASHEEARWLNDGRYDHFLYGSLVLSSFFFIPTRDLFSYLIASALGGEATPPSLLSGAEVKKNS
jgi:hypothetical protein